MGVPAPWYADPQFFTYFKQLRALSLSSAFVDPGHPSVPSTNVLDPQKLEAFTMSNANSLAGLENLENLRYISLSTTSSADALPDDFFAPLTYLDKIQALSIRSSRLSDAHVTTLKKVVQNCQNLREIQIDGSIIALNSGFDACEILQDHPFRYVSITGFPIKSLEGFDVSCLEGFKLENCGAIETGFTALPSRLRRIILENTGATTPVLQTFPLATIEYLTLYHPHDISMLSDAERLKSLHIEASVPNDVVLSSSADNLDCLALKQHIATPLACIEQLDVVPLNPDLHIYLSLSAEDALRLEQPFKRNAALGPKSSISIDRMLQPNFHRRFSNEPLLQNPPQP